MMRSVAAAFAAVLLVSPAVVGQSEPRWTGAWPDTDFSRHAVPLAEIVSGGPPRDGIPSIDRPQFTAVGDATDLDAREAVLGLSIDGDARAYPIRIMMWHEIVNDTVGGIPIAVTYCPLCNSGVVFDRRVGGRLLEFGTSGMLRHSDMVMYDRQTDSLWQQFLGEAVVGELTGTALERLPVRLEAFGHFAERHPDGRVLVPDDPSLRDYGRNPYVGYDGGDWPFLYRGDYDDPVPPMARVVAVGNQAWSLELLRAQGRIEADGLVLTWQPGQASALDTADIAAGADVGTAVVQRDGVDVVFDIPFAFAFKAFHPEGTIHHLGSEGG